MSRWMLRIRCRSREERGLSLAELMVTAGMLVTIGAIFLPIMAAVQTGVERQGDRSSTNDNLQLAVEQLDREIRSGSLIYDPLLEPGLPPGHESFVLRVYTQTNAPTRVPPNQCIRWRIKSEVLQRQSYHVVGGVPVIISDWRTYAEGLINKSTSPQVPPFVLDASGRVLHVELVGEAPGSDSASTPVRITTSIAIRNATSADPCTPVPPWN